MNDDSGSMLVSSRENSIHDIIPKRGQLNPDSVKNFQAQVVVEFPKRNVQRRQSTSFKEPFKFKAILDAAQNGSIKEDDSVEAIRLKLKKYLASSQVGKYYENTLVILSVLSCLEYIYGTYLTGGGDDQRQQRLYNDYIEVILAILFLSDWGLNFFLADQKLAFISRS
jgi:hypothetical protein